MEKLRNLFIQFIQTFGFTEETLSENSFSGFLSRLNTRNNLRDIYTYIVQNDYTNALYMFKSSVDELNFHVDVLNSDKETIDKMFLRKDIASKILKMYELNNELTYEPLVEAVNKHSFFKDDPIEIEDIPENITLHVSEWFNKNYLKKYYLKKGVSNIPQNIEKFQVSDKLYLCDDINYFLGNFNKSYDDDIARVTVFFKVEKVVDYSYFMFIVNYKDHVIASSDLLLFDNPKMIYSSRNPRRRVEDKQHYTGLPYKLIDDLPEIRKNDTTLTKLDNDVEFHVLDWKDFGKYSRIFTLLLTQKIVETLPININDESLISSKDFIEQKLLTGSEIEIDDLYKTKDFTNYDEVNKSYAKDLIDTMLGDDENTCTDLVKQSYDIVKQHKLYDETSLMPVSLHEKHASWLAVHKQVEDIQSKIGKKLYSFSNNSKEDEERNKKGLRELTDKINDLGIENFLKKILIAEELRLHINERSSTMSDKNVEYNSALFYFRQQKEDHIFGHVHVGSKYAYTFCTDEEKKCPILPQYNGSSEFVVKIKHFEQLMYIFDCKREELPKYFRCFRHFSCKPYEGNSILSNVHPLNSLSDPASTQYPNGLEIKFYISKRGYNKIVKELGGKNRPKKLFIDINGNEVNDEPNESFGHLC